ncbi:MAG: hypothetical protein AAF512_02065 [Pseudomonadota bacterium]
MGLQKSSDLQYPTPIISERTTSGTIAIPSNIKRNQNNRAIVLIDAAPGGGGGAGDSTGPGAGGSVGECVTDYEIDVTDSIGGNLNITIGAAGATGNTGSNPGGDGGNTIIKQNDDTTVILALQGGFGAEDDSATSIGAGYWSAPGAAGSVPGGAVFVNSSNGGKGALSPIPGYGRAGCGRNADGSLGDYEAAAGVVRVKYWLK